MTRAIRKHLVDFVAILGLLLIALVVGLYILDHQRLTLPSGVPILGRDFFVLKAEFQTGQALSPGQGQTVDIAGVSVGQISNVELNNGRALVTMDIDRKYAEGKGGRPAIYRNARMIMRPKTGLKDMIIELTPGTPSAGRVPEGGTIPVSNTLPDINADEVFSTLDADTRQFLALLLNGGQQGLDKNAGTTADVLRRFEPTARETARITSQLQTRAVNVRRVVSNLRKLSGALAGKDTQLSQLVDNSNAVFQAFASQDSNIRATLQELPPSLTQAQSTLGKVQTLADVLGPTAEALRPAARNLAPAQRAIRPFLVQSTPVIRDQIRPFTRIATPVVSALRPAAKDLTALTPDLTSVFRVLNYAVNELGYNPPGSEEGYLFWLPWFNHNLGGLYTTGDANGTIRRGEILLSCASLTLVEGVGAAIPSVQVIGALTNLPKTANVCTGPAAAAAARTAPRDSESAGGLGPAGEGPTAAGKGGSPPPLTDAPPNAGTGTQTTPGPSAATPAKADTASAATPNGSGG
jgi:phospholipid/cholesterol/gamma-HCH transport system substrate-binding protein